MKTSSKRFLLYLEEEFAQSNLILTSSLDFSIVSFKFRVLKDSQGDCDKLNLGYNQAKIIIALCKVPNVTLTLTK